MIPLDAMVRLMLRDDDDQATTPARHWQGERWNRWC